MDILESRPEGDSGRAGTRRWSTYAVLVAVAVGAGLLATRGHDLPARSDGRAAAQSAPSTTPPSPSRLRTHHYRLQTRGRDIEVTVDLVGTTVPGAPTIRVLVIGHVGNGRSGQRYRLVGGRCPSLHGAQQVWATGRTDASGSAVLRGEPAVLSKDAAYWLVVEPWPRNVYYFRSPPGLEGLWQTRSVFTFPAGEPGC
jgi:hypothetical protein